MERVLKSNILTQRMQQIVSWVLCGTPTPAVSYFVYFAQFLQMFSSRLVQHKQRTTRMGRPRHLSSTVQITVFVFVLFWFCFCFLGDLLHHVLPHHGKVEEIIINVCKCYDCAFFYFRCAFLCICFIFYHQSHQRHVSFIIILKV